MPANAKKTLPTGIFRKGKGYGYAFDGARHPDGTRNQLTRAGFRTVDEAVWARAEHMAAMGRGPQVVPSKQTVADYLTIWLAGRDDVRDSTWRVYQRYVDHHIVPRLGATKLRDLAPTQLVRWQKALGQQLAPATVARKVPPVSRLRWPRSSGAVPSARAPRERRVASCGNVGAVFRAVTGIPRNRLERIAIRCPARHSSPDLGRVNFPYLHAAPARRGPGHRASCGR